MSLDNRRGSDSRGDTKVCTSYRSTWGEVRGKVGTRWFREDATVPHLTEMVMQGTDRMKIKDAGTLNRPKNAGKQLHPGILCYNGPPRPQIYISVQAELLQFHRLNHTLLYWLVTCVASRLDLVSLVVYVYCLGISPLEPPMLCLAAVGCAHHFHRLLCANVSYDLWRDKSSVSVAIICV